MFTVAQIWPEGMGAKRRVEGLPMTGHEVAATLADTITCEDIIHEDDDCGLPAAGCWHLRPYLPRSVLDAYDAAHTPAPSLWRHPDGLVLFRSPGATHDSALPGDTTTNTPTPKGGVVRVEVSVEHQAAETITDIVEIDRAEWDAMTPAEREEWCIEEAEELRANVCTSGYTVLGDVDINA